MRCTSPLNVGFLPDGKTLTFSSKNFSKEYATFQLPCSKCLACRLEYGREWAIRCVHEAQMHEKNCFITLTYSDEHLKSDRLDYSDFQKFMKKLRKITNNKIGVFVTGEYGEKTKRPHWHAIIFGWEPNDMEYLRQNELGDKIYKSATLDKLWGKNDPEKKPNEIGTVTFESAGYCARYAAKKLTHGKDQEHNYHPISKKSSKHAIGKKWLEKYYQDIFNHGLLVLPNGQNSSIPRYYEKWFKENHPEKYIEYLTQIKFPKIESIKQNSENEFDETRHGLRPMQLSRSQVKKTVLEEKFKNRLQNNLKL